MKNMNWREESSIIGKFFLLSLIVIPFWKTEFDKDAGVYRVQFFCVVNLISPLAYLSVIFGVLYIIYADGIKEFVECLRNERLWWRPKRKMSVLQEEYEAVDPYFNLLRVMNFTNENELDRV